MPLVQHARRELHLKVVYYGPGLGGKTTNLERIHARARPEHRGRLISLTNEAERTLFFDLLPVELGKFRGYDIRLHLCTVPGQIAHDRTRRLVLRHVDGIVFVVDSQQGRIEDNVESMRNLEANLMAQGDDPDVLPMVVQYNKRDLPNAVPIPHLRAVLDIPDGVEELEAAAASGVGVFETLKAIVKACLASVGDPAALREGRSPSVIPGRRASMYPGGRPPASAQTPTELAAPAPEIPRPSRLPALPPGALDDD
jgi:signal recognition particle receptor subunit beta